MQCLDDGAKNAKSKIYYRLLLQGDLNSWLGSVEVPWDQRPRNDNRKKFKEFLISNYFTVVNALKCCNHKDKKQAMTDSEFKYFFLCCVQTPSFPCNRNINR